ncbi:hypothetical protein niasHS_010044 [Heterodera schachtii]|uniref:Uncharacterized protein n=2 Tax=Heterodera TaxID=34509 RepID=A0ABD2LKQ8_9BILA
MTTITPQQKPILKAVILVGGAQKGTRFRPLSLQLPKPLFPVAGVPLIEHHISQLCEQLENLHEIFIVGFYPAEQFANFISDCEKKYRRVPIRYIQENCPLGTAGGLLQYKNVLIDKKPPDAFFVLNADACGEFPFLEMVQELNQKTEAKCLILTTEATREQSVNYGSVVIDSVGLECSRGRVLHYVDKPATFVSTHISCGVYLLRGNSFDVILEQAEKTASERGLNTGSPTMQLFHSNQLWFEKDIFPQMTSDGTLFAWHTNRWWSQTKTAGAVLYANRHYLGLYRARCPEKLATNALCEIIGDVYIDPTATVDPSAKIGPNVSIGPNARVGAGVRVRESIVLQESVLDQYCCVLHSVIGWRSYIGPWSRVEGSPTSPNPNIPFAKLDNKPLFNVDGRLNPSLTILGSDVNVPRETVILNTVVLPYKELSANYKNQIIL